MVALAVAATATVGSGSDAGAAAAFPSAQDSAEPMPEGLVPLHQAWSQVGLVPVVGAQEGEIYVAATGGETQAVSYVQLPLPVADLAAAPQLSLRLVPATDRVADESARIVACALVTPLAADGMLPATEAPEFDCLPMADGLREPDGVVIIDLFALLPALQAHDVAGIALLPAPAVGGTPPTFRLPFRADQTRLVTGQTELPADGSFVSPPSDVPSDPPSPATETGAGDGSEVSSLPPLDSGSGFAGGSDVGVASTPMLPGPALAPAPVPAAAPTAGAAPQVAGSVPVTPAAFVPLTAPDPVLTVAGLLALALAGALIVVGLGRQAAVPGLAGAVVAPPVVARRAPVLAHWLRERRADGARAGELDPVAAAGLVAVLAIVPVTFPSLAEPAARLLAVAVAALGLHLLVTWAGQVSLAQAALVALPAVAVARLSQSTEISPVHLLPLAVVVGAAAAAGLGAVLSALPARATPFGTGAFALAVGALFVVGDGDLVAAASRLGPVALETAPSRAVLLTALAVAALLGVRSLRRSAVGSAAWLLAADPRAATAAGVDRRHALVTVHGVAGALAGLAGGMAVIAGPVPAVPGAPVLGPLLLGAALLAAVVLAGPGGAGGVLLAAALLFPALALDAPPLLTLAVALGGLVLARLLPFAGLNVYGRTLMRSVFSARTAPSLAPASYEAPEALPGRVPGEQSTTMDLPLVAGILLVLLGFAAIVFGWYHAGDTPQLWIQMQYLISGGIGGLGLVVVGTGLTLWSRFSAGSAAMAREALDIARRRVELDAVPPAAAHDVQLAEFVQRTPEESNGARRVRVRQER